MSRKQRKQKRTALIAAQRERRAAKRSKYGAKKFERENGRKPRPDAVSRQKKKSVPEWSGYDSSGMGW